MAESTQEGKKKKEEKNIKMLHRYQATKSALVAIMLKPHQSAHLASGLKMLHKRKMAGQ